jgi:hypothetical protein
LRALWLEGWAPRFRGRWNVITLTGSHVLVLGEEGNNRYCISYVAEEEGTLEELCKPTGRYDSYVVFQKGKLVIEIQEYSTDKSSTAKNDVISQLAEDLNLQNNH